MKIRIRIQLKPKKYLKDSSTRIIAVVVLLILLRRMTLQKTPLITRKQLACLSGGTVGTRCANPLKFGTPFSFCGGKSFATTKGIIHHICVKEQGNIPFPDSQDEPLVINKYKINNEYPAEIKILKKRDTQHPPIPIFVEPLNQKSKSKADSGKGVTYVGHWKVANVDFEQNRVYDNRIVLATVNFSFDRFDENISNIIHRAHNESCDKIKTMDFDDAENDHIVAETVPSSGRSRRLNHGDETLSSNKRSKAQVRMRDTKRSFLNDQENHDEVKSMSSAVVLSSDSEQSRNSYRDIESNADLDHVSMTQSSPEWVRLLSETREPVRVKTEEHVEKQEDDLMSETSSEELIDVLKRENEELKRKVRELSTEHSRTKLQIQRLETLMHRELAEMRRYCKDIQASSVQDSNDCK